MSDAAAARLLEADAVLGQQSIEEEGPVVLVLELGRLEEHVGVLLTIGKSDDGGDA